MSKNLVIVESPAKAKTIEKYLGQDFQVLSSIGHIRSIAKKTKTANRQSKSTMISMLITKLTQKRKKLLPNLKRPLKPLVKKTSGLQPMKTVKVKPLLGIYAKYST